MKSKKMNNQIKKIKKIKEHWDNQARKHGTSPLATLPEIILRELEIKSIAKYLSGRKKILDVGCGNGYSTIRLARKAKSHFIGCDYSEEMIRKAKAAAKKESLATRKRLDFIAGDVLSLPLNKNSFDIVISERCLQNLISLNHQISAAKEIHRVLKRNGYYIMCESTQEGFKNLNQLRKRVGLYVMPNRWHNLFINERKFFPAIKKIFKLKLVDNFSSTYYLASRIFNGKLAALEGKEPDRNHPINQIAAKLPALGDYGPLKIFILLKK